MMITLIGELIGLRNGASWTGQATKKGRPSEMDELVEQFEDMLSGHNECICMDERPRGHRGRTALSTHPDRQWLCKGNGIMGSLMREAEQCRGMDKEGACKMHDEWVSNHRLFSVIVVFGWEVNLMQSCAWMPFWMISCWYQYLGENLAARLLPVIRRHDRWLEWLPSHHLSSKWQCL